MLWGLGHNIAKTGKFEVKGDISSVIYNFFVFHSPGSPGKLAGHVYMCTDVPELYAAKHC